METKKLSRRDFLRTSGVVAAGAVLASCAPAAPQIVEKERVVTQVVEQEVAVEKVVKETVQVEVEKEVVKEVAVEKVVTATPQPAAPVEIRVQTRGGQYEEPYKESFARFEEQNPYITIGYEPMVEGWFEKTVAAMVAGTSPDILTAWGWYFYSWYQKRQSLDLSPYVDRDWSQDYIEENFVPAQWNAFWNLTFDAPVLIALPEYINHMFLHYNKDFFMEAGVDFPDESWTMDDMAVAAKQLMKRKADGTVERFGGNFPIWSDALTERGFYHIRKWGGHIVNPMNPADCMLDEPEAQAALEWMRARMWDDESYGQPLMTNYSWGGDSFASGLTATAQEGLQTSGLATTDDMPWDFDIAHEPSGPVQRSALITTDGFMAWNGTPNPDAAWEVMKWLTGVDFQRTRMETSGRIPGNRTLVENWASVVREKFPRFETVSLEVVEEALDMGYGSDDERFLDQFGANEIIGPASELVFVTGEAPVSILGDTCAEVEAVQQAYMERMGADA